MAHHHHVPGSGPALASPFAMAAWQRLLIVVAGLAGLWLAVLWALAA